MSAGVSSGSGGRLSRSTTTLSSRLLNDPGVGGSGVGSVSSVRVRDWNESSGAELDENDESESGFANGPGGDAIDW